MSEDGEGLSFQEPKFKFRPIKLRRTQHHAIEENLRTLTTNKKLAQEMYYGNNAGQSPLMRAVAGIQQGNNLPVHQRLGVKQKLIRRAPRNIFNNGLMPNNPRLRLRRTNLIGVTGNQQYVRRNGYRRPNSVQQRLYRIRPNQNLENIMEGAQLRTKLIRRRRPDMLPSRPTNYTIQVQNRNFRPVAPAHTVRGSLNEQLKMEIDMIQAQSELKDQLIAAVPIWVPGHGSTGIFMNDRFSRLP